MTKQKTIIERHTPGQRLAIAKVLRKTAKMQNAFGANCGDFNWPDWIAGSVSAIKYLHSILLPSDLVAEWTDANCTGPEPENWMHDMCLHLAMELEDSVKAKK